MTDLSDFRAKSVGAVSQNVFYKNTSMALEGGHVRNYGCVSVGARDVLAIEKFGTIPEWLVQSRTVRAGL